MKNASHSQIVCERNASPSMTVQHEDEHVSQTLRRIFGNHGSHARKHRADAETCQEPQHDQHRHGARQCRCEHAERDHGQTDENHAPTTDDVGVRRQKDRTDSHAHERCAEYDTEGPRRNRPFPGNGWGCE